MGEIHSVIELMYIQEPMSHPQSSEIYLQKRISSEMVLPTLFSASITSW